MLKSAQALVSEYLDIHAQRRKVLMIFAIMALVVIITVVSLTIFPAITMQGDGDTICGLQEHMHGDDCYTSELVCELPEVEEHHHGEGCYEKQLVCENEDEDHEHTDECYEDVLICTAEETDGHTHGEDCYKVILSCEIPEHIHTAECYPKDEAKPVKNVVADGTCFEPVRDLSEFNNNGNIYLLVSPDGNNAVALGETSAYTDTLSITPLLAEKKKLYEVKNSSGKSVSKSGVEDKFKWSIVAGKDEATIRNVSDGRYYINLNGNDVAEKNSGTLTIKYNKSVCLWTVTQKVTGVIRYLSYTEQGVVNTNDAAVGNHYWQIYKLNCDEVNYDSASAAVSIKQDTPNIVFGTKVKALKEKAAEKTKSTFEAITEMGQELLSSVSLFGLNDEGTQAPYVEESGKKEGSFTSGEAIWNYASDPATSQIESQFDGVKEDDGKVIVDKSVIYGDDDYDAFEDYVEGTFGVELSVLAQQYNITRNEIIEAPVDVMFVIDTSGSMMHNMMGEDGQNHMRYEVLTNALNDAIDTVITTNPENRVGVTHFSDGGGTMLPLDNYNAKNDKDYFTADYVNINGTWIPKISVSMTNDDGVTINDETGDEFAKPDWHGTYTQYGIALANEQFQSVDPTYTSGTGKTIQRKPVIILISDGDPTISTYNYNDALNGPNYGDTLSHGAHGYYTILSALYYKQQIADHYQSPAHFSTIGIGIHPGETGQLANDNICSHNYVTAVLNPTDENLEIAASPENCNAEYTSTEMIQMLNNEYPNDSVEVGSTPRYPTNKEIPVIENPYTDFAYADSAYLGEMNEADLKQALLNIFETVIEKVEYGFNLKESTSAVINDPLGVGMEVKGDPILRYNGEMYNFTNKTNKAGPGGSTITTYEFAYIATDENITDFDGNIRQVDLSKILVEVVTAADGTQTVRMSVPEECMPVYSLDYDSKDYIPELPARLIFQVGLTDEAKANAQAGDVFYTNRWQDGNSATSTMYPADANPYYEKDVGPYEDTTTPKEDNPTNTNPNSSDYVANNEQTIITTGLGNNGKLVYVSDNDKIKVEVNKVWQDADGDRINNVQNFDDVTVRLYRKLEAPGSASELVDTVTLGNGNDWKHLWNNMPYFNGDGDKYVYYIEEDNIEDYTPHITSNLEGNVEKITVANRADPTENAIQAKKVWLDYDGNEMDDTTYLPQIDVELWRHVHFHEQQLGQKSTVTIIGGTTVLGTYEVQTGSDITFAIGSTHTSATNANYAVVKMNGNTVTSTRDNNNRTYRYTNPITVTIGSDTTLTFTSSNAVNEWRFHTQPTYTPPTETMVDRDLDDEMVGQAALNSDNYWKKLWTDLPQTETKNGGTYTYTYYVKEISEIPGYETTYSENNANGINEGKIIITNRSTTPKTTVGVTKVWKDYFGNTVNNTNAMPDVEVELWRHVTIADKTPASVRVTIKGDNTTLAELDVQQGTNVTYSIGAIFGSATNANYAVIKRDGVNCTATRDQVQRTYKYTDTQTITADSDITITYTATYAVNEWKFHSQPIYTAAGGGGAITTGADERVGTVTLNNQNEWTHVFKNLDINEERGSKEYTYTYFVKEISEIKGYTTSYNEGNEQGVQGGELVITNQAQNAMGPLPETGGAGSGGYTLGGLAIMLVVVAIPCGIVFVTRRRRVMGITQAH